MKSDVLQPPSIPRHESAHELHIHELDQEFRPGVRLSETTHKLLHGRRQMLATLIYDALGWRLADGFQIRGRLVIVRLDTGLLAFGPHDPTDKVLKVLRDVGEIAHITKVANTTRMGEGTAESKSALSARNQLDGFTTKTVTGRRLVDIALSWLEHCARVREDTWKVGAPGGRKLEIVVPARQQVIAVRKATTRSLLRPDSLSGNLKVIKRVRLVRTIDSRYLIFSSGMDAKEIRAGHKLRIVASELGRTRKIDVRRAALQRDEGGDD